MGRRIGLIINPVAGLGGRVGLKGSDGLPVQQLARRRGAVPAAASRGRCMLEALATAGQGTTIITAGGQLGADTLAAAGLDHEAVWHPADAMTSGADTTAAASALVSAGAGLIVFVGGDGTARDIAAGVPADTPVLGVPAGVKMYSSCFAVSPRAAGALTAAWLRGEAGTREAEVLDLDEEALRLNQASARLHAIVRVPDWAGRTQARKSATSMSEAAAVAAAAAGARELLEPGVRYLLGPGGTVAELERQLGIDPALLGVDVIENGRLLARDAAEEEILANISGHQARAVLTVTGGQGFLLGRGNQQLSPKVINRLAPDPLIVVATEQKLIGLLGRPVLVDTGDAELDSRLSGHIRVVTGPGKSAMYELAAAE